MSNLSLLLQCSRTEFYEIVKKDRVKCDCIHEYLRCTILYGGAYSELVKDARCLNHNDSGVISFVHVTQFYPLKS